jgi:hypothetical protein
MPSWWIAAGPPEHWEIAFKMGRIWGVTIKHYKKWKELSSGDYVLFYATRPVKGVIGYGIVRTKFKQDKPFWPKEIKEGRVIWPFRFEFDVEYCLPREKWEESKVYSEYILGASIAGFNRIKEEEARKIIEKLVPSKGVEEETSLHKQIKDILIEIGKMQGYIAESEYPMDIGKLDVTWRRVEVGAPAYVFEIQIGGDLYHALTKLKHAYDLWSSNLFLATTSKNIIRARKLLSGAFHEIRKKVKIIKIEEIRMLYNKKKEYRDLEKQLGLL